jgi:hypothetical protein
METLPSLANYPPASSLQNPHCTENPIYLFPEIKLRGLVPYSFSHASVSDFFIYSQDQSAYLAAEK